MGFVTVQSQGELFAVLAEGAFGELIGTEESYWLDFKLTGYQLDQPRQCWELAKDVSAFANSRGGCLVMGVKTRRESHQITDIATTICPITKSVIDAQRYLDVLDQWCYPHIESVRPHWFPKDGPDGLFVLEVPAHPPDDRPVMVVKTITEDDKELSAVMVSRRDGSRVITLSPGELHRLLNEGMRARRLVSQEEPPSDTHALPDRVIDDLQHAQQWDELPVLFFQATPSTRTRLRRFYERDGVRGALERHVPVRPGKAGFGLRLHTDLEVHESALQYLADFRRAIRIDPWGLFTLGALATSDYLAWSMQVLAAPGTDQTFLNSIALVETTVEFYRFLEGAIIPAADESAVWRSRIVCRRFDRGPICLRGGPPTNSLPMLKPPVASAANWDASIEISGRPEVDAFSALRELYGLFGLGESEIPYAEGEAISLEKLREV